MGSRFPARFVVSGLFDGEVKSAPSRHVEDREMIQNSQSDL
jgi:hypothetical protein